MVRPSDAGMLEKHYEFTILRLIHWILIGVNSAVNFMIYCTMSQSFRKSLMDLCKVIWKKMLCLKNTETATEMERNRAFSVPDTSDKSSA